MKAWVFVASVAFAGVATNVHAQDPAGQAAPPAQTAPATPTTAPADGVAGPVTGVNSTTPLPDYRIGLGDALSVVFWRDREMSAEVVVRPDGRVTLPVLNEVEVVGLTTEELREKITELGRKFVTEPRVSIVVRQINSRYVFITGKINRPGPYQLYGPMTVLQLIAMAGGLREYADSSNISVIRHDDSGKQTRYGFNYKKVVKGGDLGQNTTLQPGDTVVIP